MTDNPFRAPDDAGARTERNTQWILAFPMALAVGGSVVGLVSFSQGGANSSMGYNVILCSSLGFGIGIAYLVFRGCYLWIAERLDEL